MTIEAPFYWSQILPITKHRTARARKLGSDANNLANNEFPFMPINRIIYSLNFAVLERIFSKFPPTFYHHLVFDLRKYAPKQKDLTAKSIWT
jgi:hypothetical protein